MNKKTIGILGFGTVPLVLGTGLTVWASGLSGPDPYPSGEDYVVRFSPTAGDFEDCNSESECPDLPPEGTAIVHATVDDKTDADIVRIKGGSATLATHDPHCIASERNPCTYSLLNMSLEFDTAHVHDTYIRKLVVHLEKPVHNLVDRGAGLALRGVSRFQAIATVRDKSRYSWVVPSESVGENDAFTLQVIPGDQPAVQIRGALGGSSGGLGLEVALLQTAMDFANRPPNADAGEDETHETSCFAETTMTHVSTDPDGDRLLSWFRWGANRLPSEGKAVQFLPGLYPIRVTVSDPSRSVDGDAKRITVVDNGELNVPEGATAVEITGPEGVPFEDLALLSAEYLKISDRVTVQGQNGERTAVANMGAPTGKVETYVHADSLTKANLWSRPKVWLHERAAIDGTLRSTVDPDRQNGTYTGELEVPFQFGDGESFGFVVPERIDNIAVGEIEPDTSVDLEPAEYGHVHVKSRATLNLTAGFYRFEDFWMEPGSVVNLLGEAPVVVVVEGHSVFRGVSVSSPDSKLFIVQLSDAETLVTSPFEGVVIAPNGRLTMNSSGGTKHVGAFFAREIQVDSDAVIEHSASALELLLGTRSSCALTPATLCVRQGEEGPIARFIYTNALQYQAAHVPTGIDNRIVPGNTVQGQPEYFVPGSRGQRWFEVPFESGGEVSWVLGAKRAVANEGSPSCE